MGNGATTTYAHNALGQLTDLANRKADASLLSEFAVPAPGGYDGAGNLTSLVVNIPGAPAYGGQTSYAYDSKNELVQEQSTRNFMTS